MADDDRVDYPKPPKRDNGKPGPKCPYCCKLLKSFDLLPRARHVNQDLKPYICLFDNCGQPSPSFEDYEKWANHMAERHTTDWPRKLQNSFDERQATRT
ncbi:hypothetical protein B0T10DRAFT_566794 [Thelonectria olida]|uniref:Uncharacterized protein n=1 Tax=Thelonectria olida TaxID=1576542 RepID=A0A9P9AJZ4_9HYPO|nr:hypothetical protein B0T10DRAFT_566794 [Thelonectria olida]